VIFDVNVYLDRVQEFDADYVVTHAEELRAVEMRNGFRALAHPYVMAELLFHLDNKNAVARDSRIKAIAFLCIHCEAWGESGCLAMTATSLMNICDLLFGSRPSADEEFVQMLRRACHRVAQAYVSTGDTSVARDALPPEDRGLLARFVSESEEWFKVAFRCATSLAAETAPDQATKTRDRKEMGSDAGLEKLARGWVWRAARTLGKELSEEDLEVMPKRVVQAAPVMVEIYRDLWYRILDKGFNVDKKRHENFLWDMDIAAVMGQTTLLADAPVLLVTEDGTIRRCAEQCCPHSALPFAEYERRLGI